MNTSSHPELSRRRFLGGGLAAAAATSLITLPVLGAETAASAPKPAAPVYARKIKVGVIGNGDLFAMRDPSGIRPCYYYENDEIFTIASERVALMSVFGVSENEVKKVPPAHVVVIKADGGMTIHLLDVEGQGDKSDQYDVNLLTPVLSLTKVVAFNW
jgi:hypothetical protein